MPVLGCSSPAFPITGADARIALDELRRRIVFGLT
jgi:hypothetical protein